MFYSADGLLHIYSTSSLLAEACGRLLELLRRPSQFVGSDMAVYICVNIGIGGREDLIESNSSLRKYCDSGDQCVYLLSANMT